MTEPGILQATANPIKWDEKFKSRNSLESCRLNKQRRVAQRASTQEVLLEISSSTPSSVHRGSSIVQHRVIVESSMNPNHQSQYLRSNSWALSARIVHVSTCCFVQSLTSLTSSPLCTAFNKHQFIINRYSRERRRSLWHWNSIIFLRA